MSRVNKIAVRTWNNLKLLSIMALLCLVCSHKSKAQSITRFEKLWQWDGIYKESAQAVNYNSLWGFTDSLGVDYAVVGGKDSIYLITISQSTAPKLIWAWDAAGSNARNREFKILDGHLIASADQGTGSMVEIFDISGLPGRKPILVYSADSFAMGVHSVHVSGTGGSARLYLCGHFYKGANGQAQYNPLTVVDMSQPSKPRVIGKLDGKQGNRIIFTEIHDVSLWRDTVYASAGNAGLFAYDMVQANAPAMIGSIEPPYPDAGYNHSSTLSIDGNYIAFTDESFGSRLKVYDIKGLRAAGGTTGSIRLIKVFGYRSELGSVAHNVLWSGDTLWAAWYHEGAVAFDMRTVSEPKLIASYDTYPDNDVTGQPVYQGLVGCWNVYNYPNRPYFIASDMKHGLFVLSKSTRVGLEEGEAIAKHNQDIQMISKRGKKLEIVQAMQSLSIYGLDGKLVWMGRDSRSNAQVELPKAGVYVVVWNDGRGAVGSKKVLVVE